MGERTEYVVGFAFDAAGRDGLVNEARMEVKAAVEEWFSNVSLDDLFRTKGWS